MEKIYSVKNSVVIKNEVGTSKRPNCSCGLWIDHWEKFSELSRDKCCVDGCKNDATLGAHITRPRAEDDAYKTHSYIVPMCAEHNGKHGETFNTKESCTFVWANVQKMCEN